MKEETPQNLKNIGIVLIVGAIINLTVGTMIAALLGSVMTFCLTGITLGMCPCTYFCFLGPMALVPVAIVEMLIGVMVLSNPHAIGPALRLLPFPLMGTLLLGDMISPILGVLTVMLLDEESTLFLEG